MKRPLSPALAVVLGLALLLLGAPPALAAPLDPPRPTDYRSSVTAITPATKAVHLSVIGGDAFLQLRVDRGHEVVVLGHAGEPYLRFGPDGTVDENRNSPDAYTNANRYAQVTVPPSVHPKDPPRWRRVAGDGSWAWHDHRIHWMSPERPQGIRPGELVQRWQVPLRVDGRAVTVDGDLRLEAGEAWWPWALLVGAVTLGLAVAGRRERKGWWRATTGTLIAGAGCLLAAGVATAAELSIPAHAGRSVVSIAVPTVGVVCAGAAIVLRRRATVANSLALAATAAAGGWAILRIAVFTKPILPTELPADLDRTGTALAMGLAFAAATLLAGPRPAEVRER